MNQDLRRRIDEAHKTYADTEGISEVSDDDLVWLTRANAQTDSYLAEIGRRQLKASSELKAALERTSRSLYALNVVLTVYTLALLIVAVITAIKA